MDYVKKIRNSRKWQKKRDIILWRDENLCQICLNFKNIKLLTTPKQVHHIEKIKFSPEKAFSDDNLITLCASCHKKVDLDMCFFDERGKIIDIKKKLQEFAKSNNQI